MGGVFHPRNRNLWNEKNGDGAGPLQTWRHSARMSCMGRSGPIRFRSLQRSAISPFPLQATSVGQNSGSQAAVVGPILARFPTKRRPNPGPIELPELGILTCPARHRDHEDGPSIPAACLALSLRRRGRSAPRGYLHGIIFGRPGISVSCPGITHTL